MINNFFKKRIKTTHEILGITTQGFRLNLNDEEKYQYLSSLLNQQSKSEHVLYIHVPFCNKICSFCPFFSIPKLVKDDYHNLVINYIDSIKDYPYFKKPLRGIYFGGGTPTALKPKQVEAILQKIYESFKLTPNCEISLESSIKELSDEMISTLKANKVNRLSIGIQSFDDNSRKIFNRATKSNVAIEKIKTLQANGFTNIGIDLLYNYSWQTKETIIKDLEIINSLNLAGVSIYSLNLFEKTPLYDKLSPEQRATFGDISKEEHNYNLIKNSLVKYGYSVNQMRKAIRANLDGCIYLNNADDFGEVIAVGVGAGGWIGDYQYYSYNPMMKTKDLNISPMGNVLHPKAKIYRSLISSMEKEVIDFSIYSKLLNMDIMQTLAKELVLLEKNNLIKLTKNGYIINQDSWFYSVSIITYLVQELLKNDVDYKITEKINFINLFD